jgi:hypothetical protein
LFRFSNLSLNWSDLSLSVDVVPKGEMEHRWTWKDGRKEGRKEGRKDGRLEGWKAGRMRLVCRCVV